MMASGYGSRAQSAEEGSATELKPVSRDHKETAGVPIINAKPEEWVKQVCHAYGKEHWVVLHVSERKEALFFLYDSKDKPRFVEVVQYVLQHYPDGDIEDLEGEVNLLLVLPTALALKVLKFNCCRTLTLVHVPGLMKKGIPPQKLEKLLRASQEGSRKRRRKGVLSTPFTTLESIVEDETESPVVAAVREESGTMGGLHADGPESYQMSLQLQSYQSRPAITSEDMREFVVFVLQERYRKECKNLDNYFQRMLCLCECRINLNECSTCHGTVLHAAARYGLAESAREILTQGYYNMLLENHGDLPNSWPLVNAIDNNQWSTVKVILETLSASQRLSQIRALLQKIDYKDILKKMAEYKKPWWPFHHDDLQKKLQNEGRLLLLRAVLDTMVKGCEIDPTVLFDDEDGDDGPTPPAARGCVVTAMATASSRSTDQLDGSVVPAPKRKSFYTLISESDVEELKYHPSFATVVRHKWQRSYVYFHGLLFGLYLLFITLLTTALALAAQSSDPRLYSTPVDFVRLFLLEIVCLVYILVVLAIDLVLLIDEVQNYLHLSKKYFDLVMEKIRWYFVFELLRYSSTLLIIPLRIANDPHQWWMVSLAIILSGLRLFHYATVLPFMGKYVGTLILLAKHDLPRLLGVFVIINFSFGTGLYFSLVGHNNDGNIDVVNANVTNNVYGLWLTGVQMVIEGSVLTYIGNDGFNFPGRVIYWLFVFCVTVAFAAILIAQFETSFNTLSNRASMNVILKKSEIMHKMDRSREVFGRPFKKLCPCFEQLAQIKSAIDEDDECHSESEECEKSCEGIRRKVWDDPENLDVKEYVVDELSRKLAENDKRVQSLENKLDKVHDLLLSMQKK